MASRLPLLRILIPVALLAIYNYIADSAEFNLSAMPFLEVPVGRHQIEHTLWRKFLSENLEPDLKYWRQKAPLRTADLLSELNKTMEIFYIPAVMQLVLIYNNTLYWPQRPDPNGGEPTRHWSSSFNIYLHRRLTAALASGKLQLPNVIFIYNTDDNAPRFNSPARNPSVPLLSVIKSAGLEGGDDLDILVPQMFMVQSSMCHVPWHLKHDRAFFRGIGFCPVISWKNRYGYAEACARTYLSHLSYRDQQAGNGTALDCGVVEARKVQNVPDVTAPYDLPVLERVPFAAHAHYKWLLHMEGITASSRLGQLFMINSLVLLQRSYWLEHYYRSLRPWQHYVPFWNATGRDGSPLGMDDVYGTLDELRRRDREQPEEIQRIILEANNFAIRFLTPYARLLYLKAALTEYKALFPDMDAFIEEYVKEMRAKGWVIP